jgi:hypothetical protein
VKGYWAVAPGTLADQLQSGAEGLSKADAAARVRTYGRNELRESAVAANQRHTQPDSVHNGITP